MIEQLTPTHTPHHHVEVRGIIPVEEMDTQNVRVLQLAQYSDLVNTPKRHNMKEGVTRHRGNAQTTWRNYQQQQALSLGKYKIVYKGYRANEDSPRSEGYDDVIK